MFFGVVLFTIMCERSLAVGFKHKYHIVERQSCVIVAEIIEEIAQLPLEKFQRWKSFREVFFAGVMKGSACISPKGFHFSFLSLREASGTSWVLSLTKAQKKEKKETIVKKKKEKRKKKWIKTWLLVFKKKGQLLLYSNSFEISSCGITWQRFVKKINNCCCLERGKERTAN